MRVIIWGAGDGGFNALHMLDPLTEVVAFIDDNPTKTGKKIKGIEVLSSLEGLQREYDYILLANLHGARLIEEINTKYHVPKEKLLDIYHGGIVDTRVGTLQTISSIINERGIQGAVAELGVFQGEFAKKINMLFPNRTLHLFDTFEGFDQRDIAVEKKMSFSESSPGEYYSNGVQQVLSKMPYPQKCVVYKGYFPDSIDSCEENFVFVSLDVDLYAPTIAGLDFFYNRLANGGYIMVHDYNSLRFSGVKQAVQEFCEKRNINYTPLTDMCGSVIIAK